MREILYLALFGAAGTVGRYLLSGWTYRQFGENFAYGTMVVNVIGCFMVGLIMEVSILSELIQHEYRVALTIGFLGAFTTFSTFGYETLQYAENGAWWLAFFNVAGNLLAGGFAVWAGLVLGRFAAGGI